MLALTIKCVFIAGVRIFSAESGKAAENHQIKTGREKEFFLFDYQ